MSTLPSLKVPFLWKVELYGLLDLFVYTPIPWVLVLYLGLYWSDIGLVAHLHRERNALRDWWEACRHLGLMVNGIPPKNMWAGTRPSREMNLWRSVGWLIPWRFLRQGHS